MKIGEQIKPILCELFPKETAKFTPIKGDDKKVIYWEENLEEKLGGYSTVTPTKEGLYGVGLEETPIYIYGEYFGNGIQKCGKRYIKDGNDFLVFDIKQQGWWLPKEMRDSLCEKLSLKTVPFLGFMTLSEIEEKVKDGFETAFDNAFDKSLLEEGIVARPTIPLFDGRGNRIIVKVKHCDYLEYENARKELTNEEFLEFQKWYEENNEYNND